ncbi:hypothetical protein Nepgr_021587 [Nepenthes gracilis]|uniref:Glycosyltransferase n=1 Tax=Nepenthes gracilis TaxID=150966 RepID=A0AAD3T166_NEPGR|nr:hypothetical protein Nepgr_021587 [Nepenthes gracilis]
MVKKARVAHVLIFPYPAQGHINPMIQFGKRLTAANRVKATLATTIFISKSMHLNESTGSVQIDTISDGYDESGYAGAESTKAYLSSFQSAGSRTLAHLIQRHSSSNHPIDCVVYDAVVPWILDVAKDHGLAGAAFFTQPCAVSNIAYYVYRGLLPLPVSSNLVSVPGLPFLEVGDLPSFISKPDVYPAYLEATLHKFSNLDKADFVLINTVYELEEKAVDAISTQWQILPIGPSIPSFYLDNRVKKDKAYGLSLFNSDYKTVTNWLEDKPPNSVVYVSFGSVANLGQEQMKELARGLKASNCYFLWVIRASEQALLLKHTIAETGKKGMIVEWCAQLEVLASEAVGCFLTHCGWNSTLEALCLGVPIVAMPQWADQTTNAKLVQDVWKAGLRVTSEEKGIVRGREIAGCIREVMHGAKAEEMKANAMRLSRLVRAAVSEGGTSAKNIDKFVSILEEQS